MGERRISFAELFVSATTVVALACAVATLVFYTEARDAALRASASQRATVARRVEATINDALQGAETTLRQSERTLASAELGRLGQRALLALLHAELLSNPLLSEVTFTAAPSCPGPVQLSVFWTTTKRLVAQVTVPDGGGFSTQQWLLDGGTREFQPSLMSITWKSTDPTTHPTFLASTDPDQAGEVLWSDLHYSEMEPRGDDGAAPRVVLTVQKAVVGATSCEAGRGGVLRVGFLAQSLDAIVAHPDTAVPKDPHRVALFSLPATEDEAGCPSLVTRTSERDELVSVEGELRVQTIDPDPAFAALLDAPELSRLSLQQPSASFTLDVLGRQWLSTVTPLSGAAAGTRGWLVAVLAPEHYYTGSIEKLSSSLARVFVGSMLTVAAALGGILLLMRRGLAAVVSRVERMARFDFSRASTRSWLREFDGVLSHLERANTVARAMGSQLPLELVQRLYAANEEPALGGDVTEVTLLFTDIQGFTSLSERLTPNELASSLGLYLETVTQALEQSGATIDKFIGDAVMAFWNAPTPVFGHSAVACAAVRRCQARLSELYASPAWHGLPPLVTRFGLHRARVMVGYFGSQSRLSYTALGDGVNLAARLESACKEYGVTVLVSAACATAARREREDCREGGERDLAPFGFRGMGEVVVRGKTEPTRIFELTGDVVDTDAAADNAHDIAEKNAESTPEEET